MRELIVYKTSAVGKSTSMPLVSGALSAEFRNPALYASYIARQAGKRTLQRAWLQCLLTAPQGAPRPPLMLRAVRFALEHWHA